MLAPMSEPGPTYASLTADDHVTGEAVALDLPPASLGARMVSGLVDVLVTVLVLVAVLLVFGVATLQTDGALAHVAFVGTLVAVFLVLPTTVETLTGGRSLGKLAMGLRTVRDDAGPITAQHAFVRALVGVVEIYAFTGVPAFFSAMLSTTRQAAGRLRRRHLRRPQPGPAAAAAPGADAARADGVGARRRHDRPADRAGAGRAPVPRPRGHPRAPAAVDEVGLRLAEQVAAHVSPPPPPAPRRGTTSPR